jgi:hypothetical protein
MNIMEVSFCNDCGSDVYTTISHDRVTISCRGCELDIDMKIKPHPQLGSLIWDLKTEEEE